MRTYTDAELNQMAIDICGLEPQAYRPKATAEADDYMVPFGDEN